jgi:hypothetical protein
MTNSHELLFHALAAWKGLRLIGYLDPGSGSYGYQMLIAGVTGALFFFSSIKRKVLSLFNKSNTDPALAETSALKDSLRRESEDKGVTQ